MTLPIHRQQGFGILEVMIAVAVLSIAMLSLGGLHTLIIQSSSQAKSRSLATTLAQQKLDDLRSFEKIWDDPSTVADECTSGTFCFTEIASSDSSDLKIGGGEENVDGTLDISAHYASNEIVLGSDVYLLRWQLEGDYYYCGNSAPTTTNCATNPKSYPDFKRINVTVEWTDKSGSQQLFLQSVVSATQSVSSGLSGVAGNDFGPPQPKAGLCPNCTMADLGDGKTKETSNPQPQTTTHKHSTVVTTDELILNSDRVIFDRTEFKTVNCVCQQEGSGSVGRNPVIFDGEQFILNDPTHPTYPDSGAAASKRYGSTYRTGQFNEQPIICDTCCRDHHDQQAPTSGNAASFATVYDPFRPAPGVDIYPLTPDGLDDNYHASGDHTHFYDANNDGALEPADNDGDIYYESCKLVRLGGALYVAQDWYLQSLQVIPSSQLTGATLTNALEYVTAYVTKFIEDQASSYPQTIIDVSTDASVTAESNTFRWDGTVAYPAYEMDVSDEEDFVARALYIDYMTPELLNILKCKIGASPLSGDCSATPTDTDFLRYVPFHLFNMTKLANWSSSDPTKATVTNEAIDPGVEDTYSRGTVRAVAAGSTNITATLELSNTGWTDSDPIDSNDSLSMNDTVAVDVETPTPPYDCADAATHCVSGTISTAANSDGRSISDIQVIGGSGASCTKPDASLGPNYYTCILDASGNGTITFANINSSTPQDNCVDPTPNTATGMSVGAPANDGIYGTYSTGEYRVFTFSGRTSDLGLNVNIKKATGSCP